MERPILRYTGGLAQTNAYLLPTAGGDIIIDAPEGTLKFLQQKSRDVQALILTHGHWDHIWDAAKIVKAFDCPVYYHQNDHELITHPELMKGFGLSADIPPLEATAFLNEGETPEYYPWHFKVLHIPGHCPGSICLYDAEYKTVFGGDVLFAGGVGRWDLPGGNEKQLITGIKEKLLVLDPDVVVYPGHGPETTIGEESLNNPFLAF